MLSSEQKYLVPFVGLPLGNFEFEFEANNEFFENMEFSIVEKGIVQIKFELEKKETMMIGIFNLDGNVETTCDECGEDTPVEISGSYKLVYKFGETESNDEDLIILHPDTAELDLAEAIHEFIMVSLPSKVKHPVGECNPETLNILQKYLMVRDPEAKNTGWDNDDEDFDEDDEDDFDDDSDDDSDDDDSDDDDSDNDSDEKIEDTQETPLPPLDLDKIDPRWAALKKLK